MAIGTTALPDRPTPLPVPLRPGRKVKPIRKPKPPRIAAVKRKRSK